MRKDFFDVRLPFAESISAHFGSFQNTLRYSIDHFIIEDVLKGMLIEDESTVATLSPLLVYKITLVVSESRSQARAISKL